jgi:hypothetical protein
VNRLLKQIAIVPVALAIGSIVPAYAQGTTDTGTQTPHAPDASKTGAGPRGSKVGPTTNPAEATPGVHSRTGAGPRGTAVAPSTNPAQPKNPAQPNSQ